MGAGPLFLLRGNRRKVVVIAWMVVWVVVLVAYRPWSVELASDRDDTDILGSGVGVAFPMLSPSANCG
jgi:hypothetical protein